MQVNISIPEENIYNVVIGARISNWARVTGVKKNETHKQVTQIELTDIETGKDHVVTYADLVEGVIKMAAVCPYQFAKLFDTWGSDCTTGDALIQCAVFGKLIYG